MLRRLLGFGGDKSTETALATTVLPPLSPTLDKIIPPGAPQANVDVNENMARYPWVGAMNNSQLRYALEVTLGASVKPRAQTSVPVKNRITLSPTSPLGLPSTGRTFQQARPPQSAPIPPLRPERVDEWTADLIREGQGSTDAGDQQIAASLVIFTKYLRSLFISGGPDFNALLDHKKQNLLAFLCFIVDLNANAQKGAPSGVSAPSQQPGPTPYGRRVSSKLSPLFTTLINTVKLDSVKGSAESMATELFE